MYLKHIESIVFGCKIDLKLWVNQSPDKEDNRTKSSKMSLHLILTNLEEDAEVDKQKYMENVIAFAKKSKVPCHVEKQGGSACNSNKEIKEKTVKKLEKNGFNQPKELEKDNEFFERKVKELRIDEIGEEFLPVIVSIMAVKNDKIEDKLRKMTEMTDIPSIRLTLTEKVFNVKVFFPGGYHDVYTIQSWLKKKLEKNLKHNSNEKGFIYKILDDVDAVVCFLIMKVYFEKPQLFEKRYRERDYPSALLIHLLKKEKNGKLRRTTYISSENFELHI
ncbi:unnamed protein product [Mytilus edulis]|uniref:Uncharacterized protein n=1 Tax=Mytilus edulis TaxID=6550 RepID=A0A8S3SJP0_MYTED|nr:unnamed protein product [Mytilus edulis]